MDLSHFGPVRVILVLQHQYTIQGSVSNHLSEFVHGEIAVLVVSYYFPPDAAVGGKRIVRFCKYLPEHKIKPIVLTVDEASCEFFDPSYPPPADIAIHRVPPAKTALDYYRRWRQGNHGVGAQSGNGHPPSTNANDEAGKKSALREHILALFTAPDKNRGWRKPALRRAHELIRSTPIDLVFSSGPPWTTHLIGRDIARNHGLPWIADFRDAWVSDRWRLESLPRWRDKLDWKMEDSCLREAAGVTCTTDQLRRLLQSNHESVSEQKFITISNGFDGEFGEYDKEAECDTGAPLLLHAGQLYGGRRIDSFCRALQSLIEQGRLPAGIQVRFVGDADEDICASARAMAPDLFRTGVLSLTQTVPWEEVQRLVRQSRVLLIVQGDHPTAIPAKFFEYLQTGKPILAIAQAGALRDIVLQSGAGVVADPRDPTALENGLLEVLGLERRPAEAVRKVADRYHFRNLSAQLAQVMRLAVKTHETK